VAGRGAWDQVRYEIVVPQLPHGWILLGETRAYVPLSPVRFVSVAVSASGARGALELLVRGKPAEVVTVVAQKPQAKVLSSVRVTITSAGTAKVSIPA
jgi:phosphate-selective porin